MTTQNINIRLPLAHLRLLEKLSRKLGFDRTTIIKLAVYKLGVEEGFVLEYKKGEE